MGAVQIANVYGKGKDKLSFDDRVAWTETQLEHVVDSATEPLTGQQWWMQVGRLLLKPTSLYFLSYNVTKSFHVPLHIPVSL